MSTIQDAIHRLDWASRHIAAFERDSREFLGQRPYAAVRKEVRDATTSDSTLIYTMSIRTPPPVPLRLQAADAVHSLRASIDNLICGLGHKGGHTGKRGLGFSIYETLSDFKAFRRKTLHGLPLPIQEWYESEQGADAPLHQLHDLWNEDKHRAPVLLAHAIVNRATLTGSGRIHLGQLTTGNIAGLISEGEVILTVIIPTAEVPNLAPTFDFDVAFANIPVPARRFLRDMEAHIRNDILPLFAHFMS